MATQYYDRGQPITLSTYNQLCAEDSSTWNWTGRKLEYFLSSDGVTHLTPGEMATFDGDRSYISAMWSMETSPDPVKVYLIGDSGSVSVYMNERNNYYPLGTNNDPYLCSYLITSVGSQMNTVSSIVIKYQTLDNTQSYGFNYGSYVELSIDKGENTTIEKIIWGGYESGKEISGLLFSGINEMQSVKSYGHYSWDCKLTECINERKYGLSVYFTSQGILNYMPNKDTVNPFLRT